MGKYLYCETLKIKHTFSQKLILIAPIATILLSALIGGTYNLQSMNLYWWYAFILCGFIGILCGLSIQREQRAGKFYSVYSQPIKLTRFWASKVAATSILVLGASLLLGLLTALTVVWEAVPNIISPARILLGSVAIAISSLWQIPLCLWLASKAGMFLPVLINAVMGLFSTLITATSSSLWWFVPYTWASKITEPITGIKSSGDMDAIADYNAALIPIILCLSVVLFLGLTFVTAKWFARQEVK